jgi:hypothetical protein
MSSILFDKAGTLVLKLEDKHLIAKGGEGRVFTNPKNSTEAIKVYHVAKDVPSEHFLALKKLPANFIKPETIYYTRDGEVAGFSMRYIDTKKYDLFTHLLEPNFCLQKGYNASVKMKLYETLVKSVSEAHRLGIHVGDLNKYNLLVNTQGEMFFLDTDSYQTPHKPHNGVLMEDIRDWTLDWTPVTGNGRVDEKTDALAADILTFWLFTYMHPYEGMLKPFFNVPGRMKAGKSVLCGDPGLKLPPVYQPFTDPNATKQFKEVFDQHKRYLVSLGNIVPQKAVQRVVSLDSQQLKITPIITDAATLTASANFLLVRGQGGSFVLYHTKNYGGFTKAAEILGGPGVNAYIGDTNVLIRRGLQLFKVLDGTPKGQLIENYQFPVNFVEYPYNDAGQHKLYVLDTDHGRLDILDIDGISGNFIGVKTKDVFAPAVNFYQGVTLGVSGNTWLLTPSGNVLTLDGTKYNVKNLLWKNGCALVEYVDGNQTKYELIQFNGLDVGATVETTGLRYFDVKGGMVFVPENGKVVVSDLKGTNFEMVCPVVDENSRLVHTNAGLVAFSGGNVYLINKK